MTVRQWIRVDAPRAEKREGTGEPKSHNSPGIFVQWVLDIVSCPGASVEVVLLGGEACIPGP